MIGISAHTRKDDDSSTEFKRMTDPETGEIFYVGPTGSTYDPEEVPK